MPWTLSETYHYSQAEKKYKQQPSPITITLDPPPQEVTKNVSMDWRIRRKVRRNLQTAKWKYKWTEEITLKGILDSPATRLYLEGFAGRNSIFTLSMDGFLPSLAPATYGGQPLSQEGMSFNTTTCYVVIVGLEWSIEGGKPQHKYTLKLARVDPPTT